MFAVVNTMSRIDGVTIGTVWDRCRTLAACARSMAETQRAVKRGNGQNSYLPLTVVTLHKPRHDGDISRSECELLTYAEQEELSRCQR